jgi:hypothetical protein
MKGICRFCGENNAGMAFADWVKPTFTDFDKLQAGEVVCDVCLFYFEEASVELARRMGKEKPQKMRNYSHFIVGGKWIPLSKGNKIQMRELLLGELFPELAAIADSGQKHIVFRAARNPPGSRAGWVQFEETKLYLIPEELRVLLVPIEDLYAAFSKGEIETGDYAGWRILKFGLLRWQELEDQVRPMRGKPIFTLALFLAQSPERGPRSDDGISGDQEPGREIADSNLAGHTGGLQEPLPDDDMDTVRKPGAQRSVHEQPGEVHQPTLFET